MKIEKLLVLVMVIAVSSNIWAKKTAMERGLDIAKLNDRANSGFVGESAKMELLLIDAHGTKTVRKLSGKILEVEGDGDKTLMHFLKPADVKGTKLLTWAHRTKDDDQWLYLKSIKRAKRISSRNKSSSFMGSEFSFEDLGSQVPEKYTHKHIKDDKFDKLAVWILEKYPKNKSSAYSKQKIWMGKKYHAPLKAEYYDRKGELLKVATMEGYKPHKVGKKTFHRASKINMKNVQTLKQSTFSWNARTLGDKFSSRDFSKRSLKK